MNASPIDPEIKLVVDTLNKAGLQTTGSCAGHARPNHSPSIELVTMTLKGSNDFHKAHCVNYMGYIVFHPSTYNSPLAKKIMKKYGLTGLKEIRFHDRHDPRIGIVFNPVGTKYSPGRGIGVLWDVN